MPCMSWAYINPQYHVFYCVSLWALSLYTFGSIDWEIYGLLNTGGSSISISVQNDCFLFTIPGNRLFSIYVSCRSLCIKKYSCLWLSSKPLFTFVYVDDHPDKGAFHHAHYFSISQTIIGQTLYCFTIPTLGKLLTMALLFGIQKDYKRKKTNFINNCHIWAPPWMS